MCDPQVPQSFWEGECFDAWRWMGAHPACRQGQEGWQFVLWAPGALAVEVCGPWGRCAMQRAETGCWSTFVPGLAEGDSYQYCVTGAGGRMQMHADPYAFASELRPGTASRLARLDFEFDDGAWMESRSKRYDLPINIYEMHPGSWRHKPGAGAPDGSDGWYDYEELARQLIPWLAEHHFTHVELLPLAEHPFDGSWGYQTTGYFAPTSRYGSPAQLAAFVNACHRMGIGVILDVVPVHFAADPWGLARLDGTCLYEYDSDVGHSEWGTCNFNYYRGEVRSFLASSCGLWMEAYHMDGLRLDAVSRAIYWLGDPARGVNQGAVDFLRQLNHGLNQRWPTGVYIAEDSTNYLKMTAPTRYDGVGFDYKWDMGWMHDTLDYFATPFGERPAHYGKVLFSMEYFYNELYLLAFSHDEVVHGKNAIIQKLWGSYEEKCRQLRTLYLYMFAHPGKKLNFMGNELAHFREWDERRPLDWQLLAYPFHDSFQRYFARLGWLYATQPALYAGEYDPGCFAWVERSSPARGVYAWLRRSKGQTLLCVLNTQDSPCPGFPLRLETPAAATVVLNTQDPQWGGEGPSAEGQRLHALPAPDGSGVLRVDLPALGGLLLALDG